MPGSAPTAGAQVPAATTTPGQRDQDIYDRHAAGLYRQALLTLGDADMAEQVVSDVIVDECVRPPAADRRPGATRYRLALSAYHRCQQLSERPEIARFSRRRLPHGGPGAHPCWLGWPERAALGLVIFGGLGCARASLELAISRQEIAELLRSVLNRLDTSGEPAPAHDRATVRPAEAAFSGGDNEPVTVQAASEDRPAGPGGRAAKARLR